MLKILFYLNQKILFSGKTENITSKDIKEFVRSGSTLAMARGAYKVDVRLVHMEAKKQHDVGNCEFAKDDNLLRKKSRNRQY